MRHGGERFANYWQGDKMGHADQVEIIVINDATARTAALQGGQVNMINRVEPKIVDLIKRVPGVTIRNHAGPGHYVFIMHCNTAPFDNNDLRMALKLAIDREEMLDKILRGYGSLGNDFPINAAYPLFSETSSSASSIPTRPSSTTRSPATTARCCCAPRTSPSPAPSTPRSSSSRAPPRPASRIEIKREPGDGYWSEVWNKQPFSASYWGGRSTQDQMYSTAYLSTADWNDTRFLRPDFDKMVLAARAELDEAKRKADVSRHGRHGARRGRPDPADVQPVHRRDGRQGRRLGRRSASGTDERLRAGEVLARSLSPALRICPHPS